MVDPSDCPPKADVDLADVVRRFGPQYTSQYGHRMMPLAEEGTFGHRGLLHAESWGDGSTAATTATRRSSATTAASNRACPKCNGSQTQQWLQERQAELLRCDYFHVVVTVPQTCARASVATRSCCTAC